MRVTPLVLALIACGGSTKDTSPDSGTTPTGTTTASGADDPPDTGPATGPTASTPPSYVGQFLDASGTVNGDAVTVHCDDGEADQLAGELQVDGASRYLTLACVDMDAAHPVNISLGAFATGTTNSNACAAAGLSAQVVDLATALSWNCAVEPSLGFQMSIDEYTPEPDQSVTWGGTFTLRGESMFGLQVDLTGSYRVNSPCTQGC